jgi:hypothetical protein
VVQGLVSSSKLQYYLATWRTGMVVVCGLGGVHLYAFCVFLWVHAFCVHLVGSSASARDSHR